MAVDLSRVRLLPFDHQRVGVEKIVNCPHFFITDEMGAGKTKQTIDGAMVLTVRGIIDTMIILAPAAVRYVWFDSELGELRKHLWEGVKVQVFQWHKKVLAWEWNMKKGDTPDLRIFICNYEYIRREDNLDEFREWATKKTLLVLDESSAIKGWKSIQTKASIKLRKSCGRVLLLNGTPISHSPQDLFPQAYIMDPKILGYKSIYEFLAHHAKKGGYMNKQIVGWIRLEEIQQKMAPFVLRRLKKDCLDLPPKLGPIILEVPMSKETWKIYTDMRDELVAWLSSSDVVIAQQAIVKVIRLQQITSGFLAGIEEMKPLEEVDAPPDFVEQLPDLLTTQTYEQELKKQAYVGSEKLDFFMDWAETQFNSNPNAKLLVWCRFRPELTRAYEATRAKYPKVDFGQIWGGQKRDERGQALSLLDPRTAPKGPVIIFGTQSTGSMGLNLTASNTVFYMSNDRSLKTRLQSEDRVHRPGQVNPVTYYDLVATGPAGQKTIDHHVIKALAAKQEMADWTTSAWISALKEE